MLLFWRYHNLNCIYVVVIIVSSQIQSEEMRLSWACIAKLYSTIAKHIKWCLFAFHVQNNLSLCFAVKGWVPRFIEIHTIQTSFEFMEFSTVYIWLAAYRMGRVIILYIDFKFHKANKTIVNSSLLSWMVQITLIAILQRISWYSI